MKPPPPPRPPTEVQAGDLPVWLETFLDTPLGRVLMVVYALACAITLMAGLDLLTAWIAAALP